MSIGKKEQQDHELEDLSYLKLSSEQSDGTLLSICANLSHEINENEELDPYTDSNWKKNFVAPDPIVFSSNLFVTDVKGAQAMYMSQQKESKNTSKRTTSKNNKGFL